TQLSIDSKDKPSSNNLPFGSEYDESEDYETEEEYDGLGELNRSNIPNLNGILTSLQQNSVLFKEAETETSGCIADRKTASEEQHRANPMLYVPECTSDGRYEKIQCYPRTGYCWCVDEDTGKVLTGTSVKDKRPECKHVARPFKGCPEPHKTKFLRDLKVFFTTSIPLENNASNGTTFKSEDEKIGILSFVHIDKNKNRNWERKEWKEFRELVGKSKLYGNVISECATKKLECDQVRERPVCGTDDKTYPSRCHLLRAQCSGHEVSVKHRGPCKECQQARQYALKNNYQSRKEFVPKCRSDGTYSAVQCVEEHGCWCSDSSGKPIANTTTKNGKPNCKKFLRGIRRSSPRHMNTMTVQRDCIKADQTAFIANVIQRFTSEYKGYNDAHHTTKPKQCARAFAKLCDTNNDERLSLIEWKLCFSPEL
uniref:Thyroglobulin type-1 domain-containing protein n=1 Tax=Megaselia scalaris TaxID=36166 RepID=T1GCB8_MEGSC